MVDTTQMTQSDLAQRFTEGGSHGRASNVAIQDLGRGMTALVGYGWAVYAVRFASGKIVSYRNWHGYSQTTSAQMTKMGISHPADVTVPRDDYRERMIADQFVDDVARLEEFLD